MQEQQRPARSAPVAAVQAEAAPAGQGNGAGPRRYDFFISCTM